MKKLLLLLVLSLTACTGNYNKDLEWDTSYCEENPQNINCKAGAKLKSVF